MNTNSFIDNYKILDASFEASENDIKVKYRKLALIHHPDKNNGSKKSEDNFKSLVNAYEILSNKKLRSIYDIEYTKYYQLKKFKNVNNPIPKERFYEANKYQHKKSSKNSLITYLILALIILLILYLILPNSSTTGNKKADKALREEKNTARPESGELDFAK